MECLPAAAAKAEMHNVDRQIRALIREHHRIILAGDEHSSLNADSKISTAAKLQQEIINKAYQLKETSQTFRDSLKETPNAIENSFSLPITTSAQKLVVQNSMPNDQVVPLDTGLKKSSFDLASHQNTQENRVPVPGVTLPFIPPNMLVHQANASPNGVRLAAGQSAVFIIKVPPNNRTQLNLVCPVTAKKNAALPNLDNSSPLVANPPQITCSNKSNNYIFNNNNLLTKNKEFPVPSPLITQKIALEALKTLEKQAPAKLCPQVTFLVPKPASVSQSSDESPDKVTRGPQQQAWFLGHLGLCTPERRKELSQRRKERRRRKTANPQFSAEAVEERRRLESLKRKKKVIVPNGKTKVEFKEHLEMRAGKLQTEKAALLIKHAKARQQLQDERMRAQLLSDQQRNTERMITKLQDMVSFFSERRIGA